MQDSFGNNLARRRREKGYSQFQLGILLGVSDKAVSKWENGNSRPRYQTCVRIAEILDLDVEELLRDVPDKESEVQKQLKTEKDRLWKKAEERLHHMYGDQPAAQVLDRFFEEKNIITEPQTLILFETVSLIRSMVRNQMGLIQVRGMVNGCFTAWLLGATNVNPLADQEECRNCYIRTHLHVFPHRQSLLPD